MGKGQFPRPQSQPHLGDLGGTQPWLAGRKGTQAFTHMASAACPTHTGTQQQALPDQHLMLHPDDLSVQSKGLSCIPEFNCHLPKHCMGLFQRKLTGPFRPHPQVPEAIRPATAPQNLGTPCRRSRSPGTDSLGQRQLDLAGYEHNGRCFAMILQHTEQKWCSYETHHNSISQINILFSGHNLKYTHSFSSQNVFFKCIFLNLQKLSCCSFLYSFISQCYFVN